MATVAPTARSAEVRERLFFLYVAIASSLAIVAGFSFNLAVGRSNFALPLIYHFHALIFFGWIALFLTQHALIATGSAALHRRLGWLALAFIPAMVAMGIVMTVYSIRTRGGPFFFDQNEFLFGNPMDIIAFAGIALTAIAMRKRTDWHRRLMSGAMISILGPGFGRLIPNPLFMPWAWWVDAVIVPGLFLVIVLLLDRRRTGRFHAAWFWVLGTMVGSQLIADAIAYSPIGYSITRSVVAGTPGAARPMTAFMPDGIAG